MLEKGLTLENSIDSRAQYRLRPPCQPQAQWPLSFHLNTAPCRAPYPPAHRRMCPHRSVDQREMEDKLAEFVLGRRAVETFSTAKPTLTAIPHLAEIVIQTNGLFILAKIPVKCSLVSVHHGGRYQSGQIGSVSIPYRSLILPTPEWSEMPEIRIKSLITVGVRRVRRYLRPSFRAKDPREDRRSSPAVSRLRSS